MSCSDVSDPVLLKTPAKLNLCLRILGLRADGYHELITWMQQISLYDEVRIEPGGKRILVYADQEDVPGGRENIVHRAARVLREVSGRKALGARIYLKKNIPAGAGLGGGSGNAAGVLWALNRVWNIGMDKTELCEVAARVGSDVPFFLDGPAALCRGRGERVVAKESLRSGWFLLVKPPVTLPTKVVYGWSREQLGREERFFDEKNAPARLGRYEYGNDLEEIVFPRFPALKGLCGMLVCYGAVRAMMSGSGSTVFGFFRRKKDAERAAIRIKKSKIGGKCEIFLTTPLEDTCFL
ncbi:MAG: 4-(cytidine 5'-diphospho)-2-C-methyl-D-erythritol kinase [Nitrospinae bacterium]|nr:4-(cytidine 5'-diphospho)-2-C-methyl-D-erythritol kinase [Nitrospinota bacterium]